MTSLLTTIQTSTINGVIGSTLSIGNNLTTNAIQLGTSTNTITIGGASTTTTVGGTLQTSSINGVIGSTLSIGNNLTTNAIQLGTSTNTVTIGGGSTTTTVNGTLSLTNGLSLTNSGITTNGLTLYQHSNLTLGSGLINPNSFQLGYKITTTSVNAYGYPGYLNVRFNNYFMCFNDNNGSGILLTPGTWLISYNIGFETTTTETGTLLAINWIYNGNTYLVYDANELSLGTDVLGGSDGFRYNAATNFGYRTSEFFYLKNTIVEQINTERYYNVRALISPVATATGFLNVIESKLTAVRIA